jgi:hypothetical protein
MDHKYVDYPRRFEVQALLQSKVPQVIIQKSSHLNDVLVNMVIAMVIRSHFVPKK